MMLSRSFQLLLVLVLASFGLKGQRPTEFDLFREAMIMPIRSIVVEHIDSLTANTAKFEEEVAHLKRLLGSSFRPNDDYQTVHEDLVRDACVPDSLAVALAVLRKVKFYDNKISQWGRAAQAAKALSDIPLLRNIYDQQADEWIRRRADDAEVLRQLNTMSPQAGYSGDFSSVVRQIATPNVLNLEAVEIPGLEDVKKIDVSVSYSLPGRTVTTTSYRFKW